MAGGQVRGRQRRRWEAASHFLRGFVSPSLFSPPPVWGGAGRRKEARLQPREGKPSQKPIFRATSASSRPLNTGSHFNTQPIAEGHTPTSKKPKPFPTSWPKKKPHKAKKRSKSWASVSGAGGAGEATLPLPEPSQLLAITRRGGQSRRRSQVISCFSAGCVFWTRRVWGFFVSSHQGKKISTLVSTLSLLPVE